MLRSLAKRYVIDVTVFGCGALVMVFEIIGSRLLSPFIGVSTYVWTSLIGVILASLSLGYWMGGRLADRKPDIRILAFVIFLAGGFVSLTILFKDVVLTAIASSRTGLELKSIVAALLLFAPASVALGFVTPYAVKLTMVDLSNSGKTVGRLFALSAVGSIIGTFTAGFFLIPFVGSVRTLYLIAGLLITLSLLLVPFSFSRFNLSVLLLFLIGVSASEFTIYYLRTVHGLADIDTQYSRIQVFRATDPKSGKPIQVLATDPFFTQSAMFLDNDDPVLDYSRFYHLAHYFEPDLKSALMIGGAGYTFPREFLRTYPDAQIDVVEIDPQMTTIARQYFRLREDPRMEIVHEDGRIFLNAAADSQYDAVFVDAFGSLFSVPYHLTTVEAVHRMNGVLRPNGVAVLNLGGSLTGPGSRFLRAELATYRDVFPRVYLFKVKSEYADERLQNFMIVACKSAENGELATSDPKIAELLSHRYTGELADGPELLTDDLAPVEYYNSFAQDLYSVSR